MRNESSVHRTAATMPLVEHQQRHEMHAASALSQIHTTRQDRLVELRRCGVNWVLLLIAIIVLYNILAATHAISRYLG